MRPVLLFSVASLLLCSCHREHKTIVGVVPKGANHIFWQTVHAGAIKGPLAGDNPWGSPSLEWTTVSPPPHGNWPTPPSVAEDWHPYAYKKG